MFSYHGSPEVKELPALQIADSVNRRLAVHASLVVTAPPGAGKSTLLPLTILEDLERRGVEGRILMLEPRRIAARQIAERMAALLHEPVGRTVGYRVRFESKVSDQTRIEVLTEGILIRMLVDDPTLDGVAVVIFDEFHERSLNADLALALTRETQQLLRDDLRIVVMSATIDARAICEALSAPLVECEGRMFPVEVIHTDEEVVPVIRKAHAAHEGDILVFLPGEAEIRRCQEQLGESLGATRIAPLYGMLSPQEQRAAIAPSAPGERKVVLATSIAETSLTIEGVRVVIDSGLCRTMRFDALNGLSHLETVPVSLDMAQQRTGRAGRVAPGVCYRLWPKSAECRMAETRVPEIVDADLAPMALDVAGFGESHAERLPWLTPPPAPHLAQGIRLLQLLKALDDQQQITAQGRRLAKFPCHPRIAQMLVEARNDEERLLAASLAAYLEERTPNARRIDHVAEQYRRLMHVQGTTCKLTQEGALLGFSNPYAVGRLLAYAYPERIACALQEGSGRYRLACGDNAFVDRTELLAAFDWIAIAHLNAQGKGEGSGRIFMAAPIHPADLKPMMWNRQNVSWDSKRGTIVAQQEWRLGGLVVETKPLPLNDDGLRATIQQLICQAARKEGTSMFDFNDRVQNLQRRVAAVASWHPELGLPDLGTEAVLSRADEWLPFYLERATTTAELKKIDLCIALWGLLDYDQQQTVDRLAPTHIKVASGNRIRVEYRQGAEAPVLRVRLQECFGMNDTPQVDDGRRRVLMELLSPGFKPVQLTQDLANFWKETYFEVRKELRRRYPKHAWPEVPNV